MLESESPAARAVAYLRRQRYSFGTEAQLQDSIINALKHGSFKFEREARLSATDRIDFLLEGGIGIEAKVRCPRRAIYRQLQRYASHESVTALILMTATAVGLPPALGAKPLFYVSIGRTAL